MYRTLVGAILVVLAAYGCASYELAPLGKTPLDLVVHPSEVLSAWLALQGSLALGVIFLFAIGVVWWLLSKVYDRLGARKGSA